MAVIVVTRLRLKEPGVLNDFFNGAAASLEQAQKSAGNLGSDALAEPYHSAELTQASPGNRALDYPPPVVPAQ